MRTLNLIGLSALLSAAATHASAQSVGAACGCPDVSLRPTKNFSTMTDGSGNLPLSRTLTCDTTYVLNQKAYVPANGDLFIQPGTVIKCVDNSGVNAHALIVTRSGQIWANGSESCPIIFTSISDPLDGSYSVANRGKWGGLIVLGNAFNNVRSTDLKDGGPAASTSITGTDGVGLIEGLAGGDSRHFYGQPIGSEINGESSGIIRHVALRHGGELLGTANEINGLTMGGVGSGTVVEFVEVTSNLDDAFEFFGGSVNARYLVAMHCDDDYIDYDQGYTGKIQFFYGLQGPDNSGGALNQGDNSMECDGDDGPGNTAAKSDPTIYNATIINRILPGADEGIEARREVKGTIVNSVFANLARGLNMTTDAAANWNALTFNVKGCTFQGTTTPLRINGAAPAGGSPEQVKFAADGNLAVADGSLIDASYSMNLTTNAINSNNRVNPVPAAGTATTTFVPPVDGFFAGAKYRGAFEPGASPWTPSWTVTTDLGSDISAVAGCRSDLNNDGVVNATDFGLFVSDYNDTCY
jgi:hypothetical protein